MEIKGRKRNKKNTYNSKQKRTNKRSEYDIIIYSEMIMR